MFSSPWISNISPDVCVFVSSRWNSCGWWWPFYLPLIDIKEVYLLYMSKSFHLTRDCYCLLCRNCISNFWSCLSACQWPSEYLQRSWPWFWAFCKPRDANSEVPGWPIPKTTIHSAFWTQSFEFRGLHFEKVWFGSQPLKICFDFDLVIRMSGSDPG